MGYVENFVICILTNWNFKIFLKLRYTFFRSVFFSRISSPFPWTIPENFLVSLWNVWTQRLRYVSVYKVKLIPHHPPPSLFGYDTVESSSHQSFPLPFTIEWTNEEIRKLPYQLSIGYCKQINAAFKLLLKVRLWTHGCWHCPVWKKSGFLCDCMCATIMKTNSIGRKVTTA